jgi:hypothetical protein
VFCDLLAESGSSAEGSSQQQELRGASGHGLDGLYAEGFLP